MSTDKLPDGWTRVKLGDVAVNSTAVSSDPVEDGYERYVLGKDIPDGGTIETWGEVGDGHFGSRIRTRIEAGDVICTTRGPNLRVARATFRALGAHTNFVLRTANENVMLQDFLALIAESAGFQDHLVRNFRGSVNLFVNWSDAARYEFALPPIDEQQGVVEILKSSDDVGQAERRALEASITVVDALLHSMTEVGEPTTLGALARQGIQIGPFGSQLHASDYTGAGVPVLMPADLRQRGIDPTGLRFIDETKAAELASHRLQEGDLVLPRRGELDKRALISASEIGWLCGTGSVRVRLDDPSLAPLVLELLASREMVQWLAENAVGTTMPNINRDIVARIPLRLPPVDRRSIWVRRLQAARATSDRLREAMRISAARAGALRESLLEVGNVH